MMEVAVTGIGMVCPVGLGKAESWNNMLKGKSGIRKITRFDASECITKIAGEIPDGYFELERRLLPRRLLKRLLLPSRLAIVVAGEALMDAGFPAEALASTGTGVITGCGGSTPGDQFLFGVKGARFPASPVEMCHTIADSVSAYYDLEGPAFNVAAACASGAFAVGAAVDYVRTHGEACLAIGLDTMVTKETIDGFNRLLALTEQNDPPEKASRPFDRRRSGFVVSEAACAILLEPGETAFKRGASIYALVPGHAMTAESFNIIAPEPEGERIAETMLAGLDAAGIRPEEIGYISAHGTSTVYNDLAETKGIHRVFGERARRIPVSSQKSMLGHSIGGAGAIEFAVTALTLFHQMITPTINYDEPDPGCDLDYVPNKARPVFDLQVAMTNSFGFGGQNSTIILKRPGGNLARV